MKDYPFIKCLHPRRITNPHTRDNIMVPCGECTSCRLKRSSLNTLKCQLESMSHKYTYFVTLTFDDKYLPKACAVKVGDSYHLVAVEDDIYSDYLCKIDSTVEDMSMLAQKVNQKGLFPYLSKRPLQLFLKRLRKRISKSYQYAIKDKNGSTVRRKYFPWQLLKPLAPSADEEVCKLPCGEEIRYYACGEYGPVHFRPHYHLQLYFDRLETALSIEHYIRESWPYGRIDVSLSLGKSASYTASYVNSFVSLPKIYQSPKTKPFACHSYFLGEKILKSQSPSSEDFDIAKFNTRSICINNVATDVTLWRSLKTWYFPRCKAYSSLDSSERYLSYTSYVTLSKWTGETKASSIARKVLENIQRGESNEIVDLHLRTVHPLLNRNILSEDEYNTLYRSLYMDIRVSQHFIDYVCSGNLSSQNVHDKLGRIESYYNDCEMQKLNQWYTDMENFFSETEDDLEIDDLVLFYDNIPVPDKNFSFTTKLSTLPLYQQYRKECSERQERAVKHKRLNDKNKIFHNR